MHDAQLDDPTPPLDHVPARSTEGLSFDDATSVILKSLSAIQHNGQHSTPCTTATQEKIPVVLVDGHKLGVRPAGLEVAPPDQCSSLPKIIQDVVNTHAPHAVNTIEVEKPKIIKKTIQRENPTTEDDDQFGDSMP